MPDRESVLKKTQKLEDKLFLARILDKAVKAEKEAKLVHTDFLDPYQRTLVDKALGMDRDVQYEYYGGYAGAERAITVFSPVFISLDSEDYENYLKNISITVKGRDSLNHRDYLGSLMGLGIKREKIGDILVYEASADIIVLSEIADFIKYNLTKIGSCKVECEVLEIASLHLPEPKVKEIRTTVASLRLDCVSSAGFGISRSKISEYIKGEKLNLNWEMTDSLTKTVKEGDTISIRGKGRIVLESVNGRTKKDRIGILINKYI